MDPRPLKPRTLKERAAVVRRLHQSALTDRSPSWGDERLRLDLHLIAMTLDWALRKGKDPLGLVMADAEDRRKESEKAAKARADASKELVGQSHEKGADHAG